MLGTVSGGPVGGGAVGRGHRGRDGDADLGDRVRRQSREGASTDPAPADANAARLSLAFLLAGTFIRTPRGEVPVEKLRCGDLIAVAADDGLGDREHRRNQDAPAIWIGHSSRPMPHGMPDPARGTWPVRISMPERSGPGRPYRDLLLSPRRSRGLTRTACWCRLNT